MTLDERMEAPEPELVRLCFDFTDLVLPVGRDADGCAVVPLKPIVDRFALDWRGQKRKVRRRLHDQLGMTTCELYVGRGSRSTICIRLDKVGAYLQTVNPRRVMANKNVEGAKSLETKQSVWDSLTQQACGAVYISV